MTKQLPGFDLNGNVSTKLNRFHTGHGKCNVNFFKWGVVVFLACRDCGDTL